MPPVGAGAAVREMNHQSNGGNAPRTSASKATLNRRLAATIAVSAGLLLVSGYLVFRWRENAGHTPNYGDLPTWLTFVAAAVGIPFAAYSFVLQRRQLTEQQKTIAEEFARQKKRDELLDAQLEQTRAVGHALIRAQAEQVDLLFDTWETRTDEVTAYGDPAPGEHLHMARVINNSSRPIREVRCCLKNDPSAPSTPASSVGKFVVFSIQGLRGMDPEPAESAALIRPGDEYGFVFSVRFADTPDACMSVTFTDDAGNQWRIDQDLHLART